jgi:hypothetical protein
VGLSGFHVDFHVEKPTSTSKQKTGRYLYADEGARRPLEVAGKKSKLFCEAYVGYPVYINEYNQLLPYVIEQFGDEARALFQPIDIGKQINPASAIGAMWRTYAELASARLTALAAYVQSKLGVAEKESDAVSDLILAKLRPAMFKDPDDEDDAQDAMEILFNARGLDYRREKITIEYSSKLFVPDFTFQSLNLVVEAKLCKSASKEKAIVDEINADITACQTRYSRLVFVIYDIGFIRDEDKFKSGIEGTPAPSNEESFHERRLRLARSIFHSHSE